MLFYIQCICADIYLLGRLVPPGTLGKFSHVPDPASPGFLTIDPVKSGGLTLLHLLYLMLLMFMAKGQYVRNFVGIFIICPLLAYRIPT